MGKNTKPLSGQGQRKYFRDLFRSEPGVSPEAAERLVTACTTEIAQIRVRLPLAVRRPLPPGAVAAPAAPTQPSAAPPAQAQVSGSTVQAPFDPHAFSLIVELRRGGRDGLAAKLATVADASRLKEIAKAQHVAVADGLDEPRALIDAILTGTERRVAHRSAASS